MYFEYLFAYEPSAFGIFRLVSCFRCSFPNPNSSCRVKTAEISGSRYGERLQDLPLAQPGRVFHPFGHHGHMDVPDVSGLPLHPPPTYSLTHELTRSFIVILWWPTALARSFV